MHRDKINTSRLEVFYAASSALELLNLVEDIDCWIKDRTGAFVWINEALAKRFKDDGHAEALVGRNDYDFSPRELADKYRKDDESVLNGTPVLNREEPVIGPDHLVFWSITTKLPIRDPEGHIIGTIGTSRRKGDRPSWQLDPGLPKVLTFMREHYMEPLSNEELALVLGESEEALEALFQEKLQLSPQEYLRKIRVRLACSDLTHANLSLEEVATRHGFSDQAEFVADFQKETGETPRAYRMRLFQKGAVRL